MKQIVLLFGIIAFSKLNSQSALNFSITNVTGSGSITCYNPSVTIVASSNYSLATVNYSWSGPSLSSVSTSVDIFSPGNYTVVAYSGSLTTSTFVTIGINTIAPTASYSSNSFTVTGSQSGPITFTVTALTPTSNLTQMLMPPTGGTNISTSYKQNYYLSGTGTYTHCILNDENGCLSCKVIHVTFISGLSDKNGHDNMLRIFPNPANDNFELHITNEDLYKDFRIIQIYDNLGHLVREDEIEFSHNKTTIQTKDLANGIYVLSLKAPGSRIISKKLVISN